jgi:hypothetical protein
MNRRRIIDAIIHDGCTTNIEVACAIPPFAETTSAVHGLTLEEAVRSSLAAVSD